MLGALLIAAGGGVASAAMISRVIAARPYFGWPWIPVTMAGVLIGVCLPALGIQAWRAGKPQLSGVWFSDLAIGVMLGFVYFSKVAVSPAAHSFPGGAGVGKLAELAFAALTMTSVVVFSVTMLVLAVLLIRRELTGSRA